MKLYVIKDRDSDLYVSRRQPSRLVKMGPDVYLFSTRSEAMRFVEEKLGHDIDTTVLQNNLAWDLLEQVYNKSRWFINCDKQELDDAISQFKNLKVIPVWVEEAI